jgi:putative transcriptional regulator
VKKTLAATLLALAAGVAGAEDYDKPRLLVASPQLQGLYSRTTLLVVPMNGQHVGFILNRSTDLKLGTLFPEHEPSAKVVEPLYFGGPEMSGSIFAITRRDPGGQSMPLFEDVFVTANAQVVDRIIEQTPNDARYFAGFVGWRPGELQKEVESGFWHIADPDAAVVFSKDIPNLWDELVIRFRKGYI